METIPYQYRNLPIPGGGYVTGFLFHPKKEGVLYCRTDIGGCYRFDSEKKRWVSLIHQVSEEELSLTYPISMALDSNRPERLYIACGQGNPSTKGFLAVSGDYGKTFCMYPLPVYVHGNLNGRGTGERLLVDDLQPEQLYFASQQEGLWVSENGGESWQAVNALEEKYLTFVFQLGTTLLVGTAGVTTRRGQDFRGHSLYISYDGAKTFLPMEMPESASLPGCRLNGLVAQRCCKDEKYVYITFASTGLRSYVLENGYSCDSGDTIDGQVARYPILENGRLGKMELITPAIASMAKGIGQEKYQPGQHLPYGFSGIAASLNTPGMLAVSTIVKDDGDSIFLSKDYGNTWQQVLYGLAEGNMRFRTPYMKPEYNGGRSLIHWLSDLKLNPFDDNELWFNTGTGVFRSWNLTDDINRYFSDFSDGIEETVHLNVYSLPSTATQVIDIVGDLGGFAFEKLDEPCENSFADENGNRYITCINADFCDRDPNRIVVTARGNWTGQTKGGLILSLDAGKTFRRLSMPFGLSPEVDNALNNVERPNVNAGWVAMSPDGRNIVWSIAQGVRLPGKQVVVSHDGGESFTLCRVFDKNNKQLWQESVKMFSDREDSSLFYAFGENSAFYLSRDGGETFHYRPLPAEFPSVDFGLIDCANKTEVRGAAGQSGVFYMAVGQGGLWKLRYNKKDDSLLLQKLSREGDAIFRVGLGLGTPDGDWFHEPKALFVNGRIGGEYGFYRSLNDGASFTRINDQNQMFGQIISIDGDCRKFGRFFLATGSCGLVYGEPVISETM